MPEMLLQGSYGIQKSTLDQITATAGNVQSGVKFLDKNGNIQTGTLSLSGNAGTGDVKSGKTFYSNSWTKRTGTLALSGNASTSQVLSGRSFYSNSWTKQTGTMANRGAWTGTVNPGSSIKIPAGYHNGSGKVTANTVNPNMKLVNRTVSWGDGVIFSGDDTSASKACQFGLQYYANSTYNVHIEFRIYRNNSRIDTIYINREGGLMYDPRGYIAKWYEGSGTYKYDVNVTYHAGNGSLMIGGMIVGY